MNTAVQYIKDFQGNDVWAVLPIEEYRFLRDRAYYEEIDDIPEEHKRILYLYIIPNQLDIKFNSHYKFSIAKIRISF